MTRSAEKLYPDHAGYDLPGREPLLFGHPSFWRGFKHFGLAFLVLYALGV